jgi:hypothetical protein
MVITSHYNPLTKTLTVTDSTAYQAGEIEGLTRTLLVDEKPIAVFESASPTLAYQLPSDGVFTIQAQTSGDPLILSNKLRHLETGGAYQKNISLLKKAIAGEISFRPYFDNTKLLKAAHLSFAAGNYPQARTILKFYTDAR